jgi:hypothetical protein
MGNKVEFEIRPNFMDTGQGFLKGGGWMQGGCTKHLISPRDLMRSEIKSPVHQ